MDPATVVATLAAGAEVIAARESIGSVNPVFRETIGEAYTACKGAVLAVIGGDAQARAQLTQLESSQWDGAMHLAAPDQLAWHVALTDPAVVRAAQVLHARLARAEDAAREARARGSREPRRSGSPGAVEWGTGLVSARRSSEGCGRVVLGEVPAKPMAFIDRDELDQIAAAMSRERPVVVCTGGRGVGKSALAAAYVRRVTAGRGGPRLVVWVSGESEPTLLAGLCLVREGEGNEQEGVVRQAERARDYLSSLGDAALLVVDNAEHPHEVARWLPAGGCQVLLTSNDQRFDTVATLVQIGDFTRRQSIDYLMRRTGRTDDAACAHGLAEELGDLPLALAQAAAVITVRGLSFEQYAAKLRESTLAQALPRETGYPRQVGEAILLSVEVAQSQNPHVRGVLDVMSVLDPNGVSRDLLTWMCGYVTPELTDTDIDDALGAAAGMSLLTLDQFGDTVTMHRLISRTLREELVVRDGFQAVLGTVSGALSAQVPHEPFHLPQLAAELPIHALRLIELCQSARASHPVATAVADVADKIIRWKYLTGNNAFIVDLGQQVVLLREQTLGKSRPEVLVSRRLLGDAQCAVGRYVDAFQLDKQTLLESEVVLGPRHPETLRARNLVAYDYMLLGQYERAITQHEQVHALRVTVIGAEHQHTLWTQHMLAVDCRGLGRYDEATDWDQRTCVARVRVLGPEHPDTLWSHHSVAINYRLAGDNDAALALDEWAYATRRRSLGAEHPDTLASHNSLAIGCRLAGRYREATALDEWSLVVRERVLGPEHPDTLWTRHGLAIDYSLLGRLPEAVAMDEHTLALRERVLGPEHPDTELSRGHLEVARGGDAADVVTWAASVWVHGRLW